MNTEVHHPVEFPDPNPYSFPVTFRRSLTLDEANRRLAEYAREKRYERIFEERQRREKSKRHK
jgi:hypothetical protein